VWVGDEVVARKTTSGFPSEPEILAAVKQAIKQQAVSGKQ